MIIIVSCRLWELLTDNERWRRARGDAAQGRPRARRRTRRPVPVRQRNRYHTKRFAALATEIGPAAPSGQEKWPADQTARLTDETTAAYADVISAIDSTRLSLPVGRSRRSAA